MKLRYGVRELGLGWREVIFNGVELDDGRVVYDACNVVVNELDMWYGCKIDGFCMDWGVVMREDVWGEMLSGGEVVRRLRREVERYMSVIDDDVRYEECCVVDSGRVLRCGILVDEVVGMVFYGGVSVGGKIVWDVSVWEGIVRRLVGSGVVNFNNVVVVRRCWSGYSERVIRWYIEGGDVKRELDRIKGIVGEVMSDIEGLCGVWYDVGEFELGSGKEEGCVNHLGEG